VENNRFDSLARALGAVGSRRAWGLALSGTVFSALLVSPVGPSAVDARKRQPAKGKKRKGKKRTAGTPGQVSPPPVTGPTCVDGIKNGSETDVDCGGTCPRCATGKSCASRSDCTSARCANGACQTCVDPNTDCGTDSDGGMCACRDHESGQRFCTKINGRLLPTGTPCSACQGAEQCFPINGGANGIECILPCGA
jgi:hypothetical protein